VRGEEEEKRKSTDHDRALAGLPAPPAADMRASRRVKYFN